MISQPLFTLRSQEAHHSRPQSEVLNAIIKLNIERTPTLFSCQQTTNLVWVVSRARSCLSPPVDSSTPAPFMVSPIQQMVGKTDLRGHRCIHWILHLDPEVLAGTVSLPLYLALFRNITFKRN